MRSAGNFHPEWGYLAPAPSFMRTVRIALVATAIGATAGAVVVVSLVERPGSNDDNSSIAAHALVTSAPVIGAPAAVTPTQVVAVAAPPVALQRKVTRESAETPPPAGTSVPLSSAAMTADKPEVSPAPSAPAPAPVTATVSAEASGSLDATPAAADADAATPDATPAKKTASKKHRYEARRWQSATNAKKHWRDNRGFGPLLRLFSFRAGSAYSSN
jgi:hypothetical protein